MILKNPLQNGMKIVRICMYLCLWVSWTCVESKTDLNNNKRKRWKICKYFVTLLKYIIPMMIVSRKSIQICMSNELSHPIRSYDRHTIFVLLSVHQHKHDWGKSIKLLFCLNYLDFVGKFNQSTVIMMLHINISCHSYATVQQKWSDCWCFITKIYDRNCNNIGFCGFYWW